jgi:hypothetical protein
VLRRRELHSAGDLKISPQRAEDIQVTTRTPAKKAAKPKSAPKTAAKTVAKTAAKRSTPKLPQQRTTRAAAPAVATTAKPRIPRQPRPMIAQARRNDGKGRSFVERLSERRHAQFKHAGPVCYRCKMHASQLASAAQSAKA